VPQPAEIAGVDDTTNLDDTIHAPEETPGVPDDTPGVNETPGVVETPGVPDNTPGVNENNPTELEDINLETYVTKLESELDQQIAALDTDDDNEVTRADKAREQASANLPSESDSDNDTDADKTPLPRLCRNITPSCGHLKGRDGNGSLPTVAGPEDSEVATTRPTSSYKTL
jgi:hypothetical protein